MRKHTGRLPEWARKYMVGEWVPLGDVWVGLVTITPEGAKFILEHHNNKRNRHTKPTNQIKLRRVLQAGQFHLNYQTVQFDVDGDLRDGTNRLTACQDVGVPIHVMAVYGVERGIFRSYDSGSSRTHADVLSIEGEEHATNLAAAVSYWHHFRTTGKVYRVDSTGRANLSIDDMLAYLEREPGLRNSVLFTSRHRHLFSFMGGSAIPSTLHYIFGRHDVALSNAFFSVFHYMARGEIGAADLPAEWQTIRLLYQILQNNRGTTRKLLPRLISHLIVLAWNAIHACKTIKILKIPPALAPYPAIAGWKYDDGGLPVSPSRERSKVAIPEIDALALCKE